MIKHCSNTIIHLQLFGELIVGEVGVDFLHLFPVPTSKVMDNKIRGSQPTSALPHTKVRLASEEDATRIRVQNTPALSDVEGRNEGGHRAEQHGVNDCATRHHKHGVHLLQ